MVLTPCVIACVPATCRELESLARIRVCVCAGRKYAQKIHHEVKTVGSRRWVGVSHLICREQIMRPSTVGPEIHQRLITRHERKCQRWPQKSVPPVRHRLYSFCPFGEPGPLPIVYGPNFRLAVTNV